ncbi:MAG: glycoside hydrolase family 3 C-terminal domain-containing protein [Bacteroidales bacterium]|nr:glycoside hydrolase family 3 C-terminal domain-containing protein [Bacteroidales bacterium]
MKKLAFITFFVLFSGLMQASVPVITQEDKDQAAALVKQMTLQEKISFISGWKDKFYTFPVERLGIKSILLADGPQGVRSIGDKAENSTYYPCGLAVAASWNRDVAYGVGTGIGQDARARGISIMLCPGVNIYRNALCGRNFEYYGEDPYLASEQAVSYINGIQEQGVIATIKHFCMNNQEYSRHTVSSNADERTMNEIYFPTFRKAVENGVGAVMTSYNGVNGVHSAENQWLIKYNLRERWGFQSLVMSDWRSNYTPLGSATSGLDLEMPMGYALNYENLKPLLDNGVIAESDIDEKCRHLLQTYIAFGCLGREPDPRIPLDNPESHAKAYKAAVEGPVLLKNAGGVLPLKGGKILLVGPNADYIPFGGGSGRMYPFPERTTTLYQGLSALGGKYKVTFRSGIPTKPSELDKIQYIVVAVGYNKDTEKEDADRTYALPAGQDELIQAAVATGKKVIVVVYSGGEVDMTKWADQVDAVLMAWYTGQESGRALADILSGKVSPSGRLPFTFWGSWEKNPVSRLSYNRQWISTKLYGANQKFLKRVAAYEYVDYNEGVFVGYRGVEHFGVEPLYAFGYGLTYSSFDYSNLRVDKVDGHGVNVTFTVTNTGRCAAAEVAQVYVAPVNPSIIRPDHELKGYEKLFLGKGESHTITLTLPESAFSYYDKGSHDWTFDPCKYRILVGASASDIRLTEDLLF